MTVHTPLRCSKSVMSAAPTGGARVVLMDTGNYPSFSNFLNETWTFSGTDWTNQSTTLIDANGPLPGRIQASMAYDGYQVVLYGGQGAASGQVFQDTWTWSGTAWTQRTPATKPFGRFGATAAYLAGSGGSAQTILFGGFGGGYGGTFLNETWSWNGSTFNWTQLSPATSPGARVGHVMAASATQVIVFGGQGTNSQNNHTWSFNGTTWTQLSPATSPSVRSGACMAYDLTNSIWVMFGGQNEYNYLPETWTFNGTTWTQVAVANGTGPAGRTGAQMAYDATTGKTIMFGGISATDNYASDATWSFDGSLKVWTKL
jgi:hypothetical protein